METTEKQFKKQIKKQFNSQDKKSPAFIKERNDFVHAIVRVDERDIKFNLAGIKMFNY
jgi:hypothetical protein